MSKSLLVLSLLLMFALGLICGQSLLTAQETRYGYDNHGNSWSSHQSSPGAPTYYYGSEGTSGMYTNPAPVWTPGGKSPC